MRIFPNLQYTQDELVERISVLLPSYYYFHGGSRAYFETIFRELKEVSEKDRFHLLMVLDELVTNAIEYGSAVGDEVAISLYYKKNQWVEIVVEDCGTGKEKKTAVEMYAFLQNKKNQQQSGLLSLRGRGLPKIVSGWTDELEFIDRFSGGLLVRTRKYIV